MASQVQAVVRKWKWLTPGKTIVWAYVRDAWRLSRVESIVAVNNHGRPTTVSVIDVNSAMRGEKVRPFKCAFYKVKTIDRPKEIPDKP
ncbi:MAG: hypothetical protein GF334_08700 [Candidatus Altiarchaeales archaeon]|nr:hypothetical protein [Candidatus Altiarchaeales archaeon]